MRIRSKQSNAHRNQAQIETNANQLLKEFKEFASKDLTDSQRLAADDILDSASELPDGIPTLADWDQLADALDIAGVFEEVADYMSEKEVWMMRKECIPRNINGHTLLGVAWWLALNGWTDDTGTKAQSQQVGDGPPIEPRTAARFYLESFPYRTGKEPSPAEISTKVRNAQRGEQRRRRAEQDRQGSTPKQTATAQKNDQFNPEPVDDENIIMTAQAYIDDAILLASEAIDTRDKANARKAMAKAYANAKADMLHAEREKLVRPETVGQFLEQSGLQLTAAAETLNA